MSRASGLLDRCHAMLEAREKHSGRRRLTIVAPNTVDFSSNDFLSLSKSNELRKAYFSELRDAKDCPLGSGGSRLLDGNSIYAEQLERDIARFHRAPAALLFNSGFDANCGFFSCVPQHGDAIVYDEYIHASVHEGMRLSRAEVTRKFEHNSLCDLRNVLDQIVAKTTETRNATCQVFVAVESVYSMDGDVAPIMEILKVLRTVFPMGNGHLIVDEAHSTGVFGPQGRGLVSKLGVEDQVLARLHTFGKALTTTGAVLICPPILREYLINYARSLIYTTALGLPSLAMIRTVYRFMSNDETRCAQKRLWQLIDYFQTQLSALPPSALLEVYTGPGKSPIFSICTPWPRQLASRCQANGLIVRPIVPPTVPKGGERVRVCLHSGNTESEIDHLMKVIIAWIDDNKQVAEGSAIGLVVHSRL